MAGRPDNTVLMEDVRIIFKNFSGREGMFNAEGDRNFAVVLPPEVATDLLARGWNVKELAPREEEEEPTPYISVNVSFKNRPPTIKMIGATSRKTTSLDESTCEILDFVDISQVDLVVTPYNWKVGAKTGIKAYLQSIYVTIIEDPLAIKYELEEVSTVDGPAMSGMDDPLKVHSVRGEMKELES